MLFVSLSLALGSQHKHNSSGIWALTFDAPSLLETILVVNYVSMEPCVGPGLVIAAPWRTPSTLPFTLHQSFHYTPNPTIPSIIQTSPAITSPTTIPLTSYYLNPPTHTFHIILLYLINTILLLQIYSISPFYHL